MVWLDAPGKDMVGLSEDGRILINVGAKKLPIS